MQLEHIVVGTDLTVVSVACYAHARQMAKLFGARVTLVHVDETSRWTLYGLTELVEHMDQVSRTCAGQLENDRDTMRTTGIPVEAELVAGHQPWKRLLQACGDLSADLLIVGKNAATEPAARLGGSTARIVHHAELPVLVVDGDAQTRRAQPLERLVTVTDFSASREVALRATCELAERLKLPLLVGHAVPTLQQFGPMLRGVASAQVSNLERLIRDKASERLDAELAKVDCANLAGRVVGAAGDTGATLAELSNRPGDLLVVAGHAGQHSDSMALGSVPERMIRLSQVPTFLLPWAYLEIWYRDGYGG